MKRTYVLTLITLGVASCGGGGALTTKADLDGTKRAMAINAIQIGEISAITKTDRDTGLITIFGPGVWYDTNTVFTDESSANPDFGVDDLALGDQLEVSFRYDSRGNEVATHVTRIRAANSFQTQGLVSDYVENTSITVITKRYTRKFAIDGSTDLVGDVQFGSYVEVAFKEISAGGSTIEFTATRVEARDPQVPPVRARSKRSFLTASMPAMDDEVVLTARLIGLGNIADARNGTLTLELISGLSNIDVTVTNDTVFRSHSNPAHYTLENLSAALGMGDVYLIIGAHIDAEGGLVANIIAYSATTVTSIRAMVEAYDFNSTPGTMTMLGTTFNVPDPAQKLIPDGTVYKLVDTTVPPDGTAERVSVYPTPRP